MKVGCEAAGHMVSIVGKQRENTLVSRGLSPPTLYVVQGLNHMEVLPILSMGLSSVKPLWKCPHRHAESCVSLVITKPVRWIGVSSYHSTYHM